MAGRDHALVRGLVAVLARRPGSGRRHAQMRTPHRPVHGELPWHGRCPLRRDIRGRPRDPDVAPRDLERPDTPIPIEPIVGPSSVILTSGDQHRRQRRMLSPAFRGAQMRRRARAMAQAAVADSAGWRAGDRVALHQRLSRRSRSGSSSRRSSASGRDLAATRSSEVVSALLNTNTAPLMLVPGLRQGIRRTRTVGAVAEVAEGSSTACCPNRSRRDDGVR